MRVVNLIWGFSLGAGIDKCYLTYAKLNSVDCDITIKNICVNVLSRNSHIEPLKEIGVSFVDIKNPLDFSWMGKLKREISDFHADVLFTHGFNGAIMAMLERYLKGLKIDIVLTYHGAYHAPTKVKKIIEPIYNGLTHFIYRHVAKATICVAEYSRKYLISKGVPEEKVVTVHNGIKDIEDSAISQIPMRHDVVNIVTASRIDKVKGLSFMMEAVAILKQRGMKFHYYMIGEGPELEVMKQMCKQKKLEDIMSFEGFQSNVSSWLASADIFALPSLYEYHSIAVLEAMRAGKGIVATTVGGNGESITNMQQGILVPHSDPVALADGLERMINDEPLRHKLAKAARLRYENEFTEDAMKRGIVKVLKS